MKTIIKALILKFINENAPLEKETSHVPASYFLGIKHYGSMKQASDLDEEIELLINEGYLQSNAENPNLYYLSKEGHELIENRFLGASDACDVKEENG